MKLTTNWIVEGLIDFEYKKFMLLGYLKRVSQNFDEQKLYPFLADLIFHYQNLVTLKESKQATSDQFSQKIKKIDLDNFRIEYERVMNDDKYMEEVEHILNYAIPKIQQELSTGKEIYNSIEEKLAIFPVGIMPLHANMGYMLLKNGETSDTQVFDYTITIFANASEKYRAIKTRFVDSYIKQFTNTYEAIKLDLIKRNKNLPNPATFVVESPYRFPLNETFLPIAKRSLVRFITQHNGLA